jgi:hypothetical protein
MHYQIKLIGINRSPRKPWLALGMDGNFHFGGFDYAYKFDKLGKANEWLNYLKGCGKKVFMTWHDGKNWGEVNRDVLADMNPTFFDPWK